MLLSNLSKGLAEVKSTGYGERVEITAERLGSRRSGRKETARRRRNSPNKMSDTSDSPTNRNKFPLVLPKTFTTRKGPLVLYTDSGQSRDFGAGNWSRKSTAASRDFNLDFVLQSGPSTRTPKSCVHDRKLQQPPSVASFAEAVLNFNPKTPNKESTTCKAGKSEDS